MPHAGVASPQDLATLHVLRVCVRTCARVGARVWVCARPRQVRFLLLSPVTSTGQHAAVDPEPVAVSSDKLLLFRRRRTLVACSRGPSPQRATQRAVTLPFVVGAGSPISAHRTFSRRTRRSRRPTTHRLRWPLRCATAVAHVLQARLASLPVSSPVSALLMVASVRSRCAVKTAGHPVHGT